MMLALEKAVQELEDKIANPVGEIHKEFGGIRVEMREILQRRRRRSTKERLGRSRS